MEGKFFLGKYLIWVILLLGQLHGYRSCVEKERNALLELKKYIISITEEEASDSVLPTWTYVTERDCCRWEGVKCNRTSKRVTEIAFGKLYLKVNSLLNLSLLHPFEDVRSLSLSTTDFDGNQFSGLFDDFEGYKGLGRLRNLEILDLSYNSFDNTIFPFLNFAISLKSLLLQYNNFGGPLPAKELKDLTNLELLDLSMNRFNGSIPVEELSALSKLKSLDLSVNEFSAPTGSQGYKNFERLRNLEILKLSFNKFNNSIFPFLNSATTLTSLFLERNYMDGPFPAEELKDLTNLKLLDLSENKFCGSIPIRGSSSLRKLEALDLSNNEFSGSIELIGICDMKNMQELDLSGNKLVGQFPLCLTSLSGLRALDLSSNQLTGNLPSTLGNLESLKYLSLIDNNFEGFLSVRSLANLSELRVLKLGSKSKSLHVSYASSWKPKFQLEAIVLRSCNLVKVPHFLLHQNDLNIIDLSDNKISGAFPQWLLENNTKLYLLLLQNNNFTSFQLPKSAHSIHFLNASANQFNHLLPENIGLLLPDLVYLNLAHSGFEGTLPSSLGNMRSVEYLDLSHNSLHGELPTSLVMSCYKLNILRLSHNNLTGEALPKSVNITGIVELAVDNNQFTGTIGEGLRRYKYLELLDISSNSLTGVIPSWIGEFEHLSMLLVSDNMFEGEIPISLFNLPNLQVMDLSSNYFAGDLHHHYVNSTYPVALFLNNNYLSGVIPDTLLTNVPILDLRYNKLSGSIPKFINTQNTSILLLRGNNLTGCIPHQLCGLVNIKILDLADNRLNGSIPPCLSSTSFGTQNNDNGSISLDGAVYYFPQRGFESLITLGEIEFEISPNTQIKIEFATKHRYDTYLGGNLKLLFGMDLSQNELSGEIPAELGVLVELQGLNLSHNKLSGAIPESFSGLKNVESLDLSFNMLQGHIPPRLTDLSSLAVFNVSFNNLSGVIPQGKQFNTFDSQSFLGNPFLCGQQINRSCDSSNFREPDSGVRDDESQIDMVSFYWSSLAAYVTVLLGIFSSLTFDSPWRRFWFYLVDAFIYKAKNLFW